MKKDIHPKYYPDAKIICACGNVIRAGATVAEMKVEICSACHPFVTGKQKFLDTAGRVERFSKKFGGSYSFQKAGPAPAGAKAPVATPAADAPAAAAPATK